MIHTLQTTQTHDLPNIKALRDSLAKFLTDQERAQCTFRTDAENKIAIQIRGDGLFLCKIARHMTEKGYFE